MPTPFSAIYSGYVHAKVGRMTDCVSSDSTKQNLELRTMVFYLEAVRNDNKVTSEYFGKLVVRPSSFTEGSRYECMNMHRMD
ncbi:hypothetical protein TNCV_3842611 [Trichonephila clavipes]|nr:hypothetical protein TNCV_3842611 [Trichonephila clavipes]